MLLWVAVRFRVITACCGACVIYMFQKFSLVFSILNFVQIGFGIIGEHQTILNFIPYRKKFVEPDY